MLSKDNAYSLITTMGVSVEPLSKDTGKYTAPGFSSFNWDDNGSESGNSHLLSLL